MEDECRRVTGLMEQPLSRLGSQSRRLWRELLRGARCGERLIWSTVTPASYRGQRDDLLGQCFHQQFSPGKLGSRAEAFWELKSSSALGSRSHSSQTREETFQDALRQGEIFSMTRCFTESEVGEYSKLCGDSNPIHREVSAAKAAGYNGCLVHGMLYAGLFPAIIGSNFPGAVYVSQTLEFCNPVMVGENVVAQVEVTETKKLRRQYKVTFSTTCHKGEVLVLKGTAVALLPVSMRTSL